MPADPLGQDRVDPDTTEVRVGIITSIPWLPGTTPEQCFNEALAEVELAESLGFDSVWFTDRFYFGSEADDSMNAQAFAGNVNPFGARLQAVLGSDIGHWDVPVMNDVVGEAYELVERGALTAEDFRDLMFTNPVTLHARMNPDFFKGTRVEGPVADLVTR